MPGFDGTGPNGMGPMTGGGRGFCAVPVRPTWPAYAGTRFAMPYGPQPVRPYYGVPLYTQETARHQELDYLKGLSQSMKGNLKEIEDRIQQIESKKE